MRRLLLLVCAVLLSPGLHAHLMVAQKGTLNIVDNGAFVVLSLPVSAFQGVDDDGDHKLSVAEFKIHQAELLASIRQNVRLFEKDDPVVLQGILLTPVTADHDHEGLADQLVVMGKFPIAADADELTFQVELYGGASSEQLLEVTATRPAMGQEQVMALTRTQPQAVLFPEQ